MDFTGEDGGGGDERASFGIGTKAKRKQEADDARGTSGSSFHSEMFLSAQESSYDSFDSPKKRGRQSGVQEHQSAIQCNGLFSSPSPKVDGEGPVQPWDPFPGSSPEAILQNAAEGKGPAQHWDPFPGSSPKATQQNAAEGKGPAQHWDPFPGSSRDDDREGVEDDPGGEGVEDNPGGDGEDGGPPVTATSGSEEEGADLGAHQSSNRNEPFQLACDVSIISKTDRTSASFLDVAHVDMSSNGVESYCLDESEGGTGATTSTFNDDLTSTMDTSTETVLGKRKRDELLGASVNTLAFLGEEVAARLGVLGIHTVEDLNDLDSEDYVEYIAPLLTEARDQQLKDLVAWAKTETDRSKLESYSGSFRDESTNSGSGEEAGSSGEDDGSNDGNNHPRGDDGHVLEMDDVMLPRTGEEVAAAGPDTAPPSAELNSDRVPSQPGSQALTQENSQAQPQTESQALPRAGALAALADSNDSNLHMWHNFWTINHMNAVKLDRPDSIGTGIEVTLDNCTVSVQMQHSQPYLEYKRSADGSSPVLNILLKRCPEFLLELLEKLGQGLLVPPGSKNDSGVQGNDGTIIDNDGVVRADGAHCTVDAFYNVGRDELSKSISCQWLRTAVSDGSGRATMKQLAGKVNMLGLPLRLVKMKHLCITFCNMSETAKLEFLLDQAKNHGRRFVVQYADHHGKTTHCIGLAGSFVYDNDVRTGGKHDAEGFAAREMKSVVTAMMVVPISSNARS